MSAETTQLPMDCPGCGGNLIAEVRPAGPESQPIEWVCPHCFRLQTNDFGGKLVCVTAIGEKPKEALALEVQAKLILSEMLQQDGKKPN